MSVLSPYDIPLVARYDYGDSLVRAAIQISSPEPERSDHRGYELIY